MTDIEVRKKYGLEEWELHLDMDTSPKRILETVLDCVVDDIVEAGARLSIDDHGKASIWIDANSFEISIPLESIGYLLIDTEVEAMRQQLGKLVNRIKPI